jgi:hypothetical protein
MNILDRFQSEFIENSRTASITTSMYDEFQNFIHFVAEITVDAGVASQYCNVNFDDSDDVALLANINRDGVELFVHEKNIIIESENPQKIMKAVRAMRKIAKGLGYFEMRN